MGSVYHAPPVCVGLKEKTVAEGKGTGWLTVIRALNRLLL
jgi:hypothetical protein